MPPTQALLGRIVVLLPAGTFAAYRFSVINQRSPANLVSVSGTVNIFNIKIPNWGCAKLIPLASLVDPAAGFLVGDRLKLKVELAC